MIFLETCLQNSFCRSLGMTTNEPRIFMRPESYILLIWILKEGRTATALRPLAPYVFLLGELIASNNQAGLIEKDDDAVQRDFSQVINRWSWFPRYILLRTDRSGECRQWEYVPCFVYLFASPALGCTTSWCIDIYSAGSVQFGHQLWVSVHFRSSSGTLLPFLCSDNS